MDNNTILLNSAPVGKFSQTELVSLVLDLYYPPNQLQDSSDLDLNGPSNNVGDVT